MTAPRASEGPTIAFDSASTASSNAVNIVPRGQGKISPGGCDAMGSALVVGVDRLRNHLNKVEPPPCLTIKLSSGGRAESLGTPRNRHRGRRLLQRLVRPP
jgi:hypothetical protein